MRKCLVPSAKCEVRSLLYRWSHYAPRTRHPAPRTSAGFSLLELAVVIFILILAAALVAPGFSRSFGQLRLKAATRDLAALFRFARTQAVSSQGVLEVVLDRHTNTYWLQGPDWNIGGPSGSDQGAAEQNLEQPRQAQMVQARMRPFPAGVTLKSVVLDTGPLREDERGSIAFYPQGSSTGGEVVVSDEKGRGFKIVVDPSVGLVRIEAGPAA
ncbi:MAG TPA: GspH/FimT family pseudopilin [Candidatus Methylomirabilis sp.]|nr:GspH/FimT family pseudopilin [Candidatus Methylomirabilis sp.]